MFDSVVTGLGPWKHGMDQSCWDGGVIACPHLSTLHIPSLSRNSPIRKPHPPKVLNQCLPQVLKARIPRGSMLLHLAEAIAAAPLGASR